MTYTQGEDSKFMFIFKVSSITQDFVIIKKKKIVELVEFKLCFDKEQNT